MGKKKKTADFPPQVCQSPLPLHVLNVSFLHLLTDGMKQNFKTMTFLDQVAK